MKFLPYLLKHLRRNWFRTTLTVLAMALCIFLFCTLQTVLAEINGLLEGTSARRLVTRHAVSLVFNIPLSYGARIQSVPGVKRVALNAWFGGSLPAKKEEQKTGEESSTADFSNFFPNLAVDPEPFFAMYPEYVLPPEQFRDFMGELRGAVIGRKLADRFGWKLGDTFYLESFIPPHRKPDGPFEFIVKGIFDTDPVKYPGTDTNIMIFNHKYLYEARSTTRRRPGRWHERSTRSSRTRTPRPAPRPRRPSRRASWPWPATSPCCSTASASR
jgi:putative ABC transport system permease protein